MGSMLRSMKDLNGFTIGATDGDIGQVETCYFDDASFTVRHLVVDTSGWLAGRKVLISPRALRDIDWDAKRINAALTKAQVEQSPDIDTDRPVSRQREIEYDRYYGYPSYWTGPYLWGDYPAPFLSDPATASSFEHEQRWEWEVREEGDPHLRSSATVIGNHIAATDGDIGHVEDFLVDEATWTIRYMVVDTSNWWSGKTVLVSPGWIAHVDWDASKVGVDMTREQIKDSPEYDPSAPVQRDYETRLHGHYGRRGYWAGQGTGRIDRRDEATVVRSPG
jgi:hypothetical protein